MWAAIPRSSKARSWQRSREAVHLGVTLTLYSIEAAQAASRAALALGKTALAHIKIDTGMGRLGIRAEQLENIVQLVKMVRELPGLQLEGIFTHFAMADAFTGRDGRGGVGVRYSRANPVCYARRSSREHHPGNP